MFKALALAVIVVAFAAAVGGSTGHAMRKLMDDLAVYSASAQE